MSKPNEPAPPTTLASMIDALAKTFVIAHTQDSDEHLAQALVFNAGRLAWRMREQGLQVEHKSSISDVVTEADRAAERFITTALEQLRPDDAVIGEEGAQREGTSGRTWVVDPVDGTYNFTSGSDYWCSALALIHGHPSNPERICFGAVHRPAMGYTWFGGPEIPTQRDGKEVAQLTDAPAAGVCLGTYIHPTKIAEPAVMQAWSSAASRFASLRMFGAASVDLGGVADGALGCWFQHSVRDWDWLPGYALVLGAGGVGQAVEAGGVVWKVAGNSQAVREAAEALHSGAPS